MKKNNLKGKRVRDVIPIWEDLSLDERDAVIDHVDDALSKFNRGMAELAEDLKKKKVILTNEF